MARYKIVKDQVLKCRLIDVKQKPKFVLQKYGEYDTGKFLFSFYWDQKNLFDDLCENMKNKGLHTIHEVTIESEVGVYHKYTWDDVDRGFCTRNQVGEIQRDDNDDPIVFKTVVVYAKIDKLSRPSASYKFQKDYIEIDSPSAEAALNYRKRQTYNSRCFSSPRYSTSDDYISDDAYEAYERSKWDRMDMNEEDRIMDALENGDADIYGF